MVFSYVNSNRSTVDCHLITNSAEIENRPRSLSLINKFVEGTPNTRMAFFVIRQQIGSESTHLPKKCDGKNIGVTVSQLAEKDIV